jgi:integrase/recombinase XerC
LGRTCGIVPWALEIRGLRSSAYRDVRGPGESGFRRLLAEVAGHDGPLAKRDCAILRLAHDLALRRNEIVSIDVPRDVDLEGKRVQVFGKGESQGLWLTLPQPTAAALGEWITVRGNQEGPLFHRMDRAGRGQGRLSGESLRLLLMRLGKRTGVRAKPHGLRHSAITTALDRTSGDVRRVRQFSRHKNVETLMRYDDARRDDAGQIASIVASEI